MKVGWKILLCYPGHVLTGPHVDLGYFIRRILIENDGDVSSVSTSSHILLIWTLKNTINYVSLSQLSVFAFYIKYDMFAVITLEPPISRPQLILPLDKCSSGNLYEN